MRSGRTCAAGWRRDWSCWSVSVAHCLCAGRAGLSARACVSELSRVEASRSSPRPARSTPACHLSRGPAWTRSLSRSSHLHESGEPSHGAHALPRPPMPSSSPLTRGPFPLAGIRFPAASRVAVDEAHLADRRPPLLVAPAEGVGLGEARRPQDPSRTRDRPLRVERVRDRREEVLGARHDQ